jgi:hypothetical protein
MEVEKSSRCPHYQLYSEPLGTGEPPAYLAVRRCLLAERMIRLLRRSSDGNALADRLVIEVRSGQKYAFAGPDLDAVTQRACVLERCEERCTPAYEAHLLQFGIVDPGEEDVACDEEEENDGPVGSSPSVSCA